MSDEYDHQLADDGTVYVLKFPGGAKEYEFVSHASYQRLQRELQERGEAAQIQKLEFSDCTLCSSVASDGFYKGCMVNDQVIGWAGFSCDGKGKLVRWKPVCSTSPREGS